MTTISNIYLVGGFVASIGLMGCVSKSSYDALDAQNAQLQQQASAQSKQIADDQVRISRLQGAIKYTIDSDLVFAPGSWKMSEQGKDVVSKMADKLAPTLQEKIVVNGYTDDAPIGRELEEQGISSNQELSEKRAETVRKFMVSQGVDPDLISAVGHGDSAPKASNETASGRSQNRRVEVTLGG